VGLLVFGGNGFLQLPPTLDHSTFERFLESASSAGIPDLATNFESAADLAAASAAREGDSRGAAIVFLSDGEDTEGKLMDAIATLQRARVPVHTIGVGTAAGATIPDRDSLGRAIEHRDYAGRVVVTQLKESNLRDIARLTGGSYARWTDESSVAPIVRSLSQLHARRRSSSTGISLAERFQWPLALALVALFLEGLVPLSAAKSLLSPPRGQAAASRVVAAIVLALGCSTGPATLARRGRAEQLYDGRDFKSAYGAFTALAQTTSPRDADALAVLQYNSGDAAYRMGKFADAVRHFRAALTGPTSLQQRAQYNLGNSYVWLARAEADKRGSLQAAVNAYEEAVLLDPSDVDAKWNLELAVAKLAQEQQRLGGGPRREANWGGGNLTKSGYAGTPQTGAGATPGGGFGAPGGDEVVPEISESDARKMLAEAERAQVTGQDVQRPSRGRQEPRRRDW
jgi:Ca-activated chloride channel family protein